MTCMIDLVGRHNWEGRKWSTVSRPFGSGGKEEESTIKGKSNNVKGILLVFFDVGLSFSLLLQLQLLRHVG